MKAADLASYKVNRDGWAPGPWDAEPEDRVDWEHAGLPCLALRHPKQGNWCGYTAVPPGHPLHGADREATAAEVHGGLTYEGKCSPPICHVPKPGEPDDMWWFGFDCGHVWDLKPGTDTMLRTLESRFNISMPSLAPDFATFFPGEIYRDLAYVRAQVNGLAEQLAHDRATS